MWYPNDEDWEDQKRRDLPLTFQQLRPDVKLFLQNVKETRTVMHLVSSAVITNIFLEINGLWCVRFSWIPFSWRLKVKMLLQFCGLFLNCGAVFCQGGANAQGENVLLLYETQQHF